MSLRASRALAGAARDGNNRACRQGCGTIQPQPHDHSRRDQERRPTALRRTWASTGRHRRAMAASLDTALEKIRWRLSSQPIDSRSHRGSRFWYREFEHGVYEGPQTHDIPVRGKGKTTVNAQVILMSELTCPHCGYRQIETMPTDACIYFHQCWGCNTMLRPKLGDCCVFCSYGSVPCPPVQASHPCCRTPSRQ